MQNRKIGSLAALFFSLALLSQGCAGIPVPVNAPAYRLPNVTASEQHTTAPPTAAPSATPAPVKAVSASPVPSVSPARDVVSDVNDHSAGDGQTVYYFSADGIHRMDADGSHDQLTGIKDCCEFLALDGEGLYYLACDRALIPDTCSKEWDAYSSFDLMLYHADTGEVETLMRHVLDACPFGGGIYAVDHMNHGHIVRYDRGTKAFSDVSGFPAGANASDWVGVWACGGNLYMDCTVMDETETHQITGDTIGAAAIAPPEEDDTAAQGCRVDDQTGKVSVWTGSAWQKLPLTDVNDVLPCGAAYYILAGTPAGGNRLALYEAAADGSVKEIAGPVDISGCNLVIDEIAGGWYFAFGVKPDGETVEGVLLKYKIG